MTLLQQGNRCSWLWEWLLHLEQKLLQTQACHGKGFYWCLFGMGGKEINVSIGQGNEKMIPNSFKILNASVSQYVTVCSG